MTAAEIGRRVTVPSLPDWLTKAAFGFVYWVAFLLVLEPGNVLRAARTGHSLTFDHEITRIPAAALLGTAILPLLLFLVRRFPLEGPRSARRASLQFGCAVALAFGLNVTGSFLDAWVFRHRPLPTFAAIQDQLVGNWLLLSYAILALTALLHLTTARRSKADGAAPKHSQPRTRISVRTRGHVHVVDLSNVDWIETQGNYVALHIGTVAHLVRDTAANLAAQLDPDRFVRIHRRAIVSVDHIESIKRLTNGDALVTLKSGEQVRASRRYRKALWERWEGRTSKS